MAPSALEAPAPALATKPAAAVARRTTAPSRAPLSKKARSPALARRANVAPKPKPRRLAKLEAPPPAKDATAMELATAATAAKAAAPARGGKAPAVAGAREDGRIDALINSAFAGKKAEEEPKPAKSDKPAPGPALGHDAILAGMRPLMPKVKDCYRQHKQRGIANVRVEVDREGSVQNATVEGPLAKTPSGTCVEAAVMSARFPASAGMSFRYPFPLR
jgi:hypothetical protein